MKTNAEPLACPLPAVRSINIHPRLYWSKNDRAESRSAMLTWLDLAARANLNILHAWMESPEVAALAGEARYAESELFNYWSSSEGDVLQELLDEASLRGMGVHLWYSFTRYKRPTREWVPEYDPGLSLLPPGNPDWASIRKSEYLRGMKNPATAQLDASALCNNESAAHEWTLRVLARLFDHYPLLRGLRIEEPGYMDIDRCVCYRCQSVYSRLYDEPGEHLLRHVHATAEETYRDQRGVPVKTAGTDLFVRKLYEWWQREHPEKALSFNGSWDARWDRVRGRNWAAWAAEGLVPSFSPQAYATTTEDFLQQVRDTMANVTGSSTVIVPSIGVKWSRGTNTTAEILRQIRAAMELDESGQTHIAGINLFSGGGLTPELAAALATGPFQNRPAPAEPARGLS